MKKRVAIVGGGQLALMMAQAAASLDVEIICLEPHEICPASKAARIIEGAYDDISALQKLVSKADVLTYEFENVSPEALTQFEKQIPIYPPIQALGKTQNRLIEKNFLQSLDIPTAPFKAINSFRDLEDAIEVIGFPAVLKTQEGGYDGKGQWVLKTKEDLVSLTEVLKITPCILEGWVRFERELSLIAVRSTTGEVAFYPLVENSHENGILRESRAPFVNNALQAEAEAYLRRLLEALSYVGVICVEFFHQAERLIANEIAPRVHNSGHWTIEGAVSSQFENHLRAILGMPLGSTEAKGSSLMINLIGELPSEQKSLNGVYWHCYGKEPRPLRKLGHLTLVALDDSELQNLKQNVICRLG